MVLRRLLLNTTNNKSLFFATRLFSLSTMQKNPEIRHTKHFINNEFVDSVSGKTFPLINPATEEEICQVSEGDAADVDRAVQAAETAFKRNSTWRTMDASERSRILHKAYEILTERADYIASVETLDTGKPFSCALPDIQHTADCYRYYSGLAETVAGKTIQPDGNYFAYTRPEPIGICGQIIPWNYPASLFAWKVGPALACGNVCIVKPSEMSPLSALLQAQALKDAGLPAGVLNIVNGYGPIAGSALVKHPKVGKIAFTGSTATAQKIMVDGSSNLKRFTMELGGKSPIVIFPDADLDLAAEQCMGAIMGNCGQNCCAGSRNFVHEKVYDDFVTRAVKLAKNRVVGDPWDPKTDDGSLISETQMNRVLSYIESGISEGAKLECGGKRIGSKGFFIEPTVFSNVTDDMKIAREEIFGPVQSILKFSDTEEVIDRANNTKYGLAAGVFTSDFDTAMYLSHSLKGGSTWVNCADAVTVQTPFGGFKQSGFGKELGEDAMKVYYDTKTVMMSMKKKNS